MEREDGQAPTPPRNRISTSPNRKMAKQYRSNISRTSFSQGCLISTRSLRFMLLCGCSGCYSYNSCSSFMLPWSLIYAMNAIWQIMHTTSCDIIKYKYNLTGVLQSWFELFASTTDDTIIFVSATKKLKQVINLLRYKA